MKYLHYIKYSFLIFFMSILYSTNIFSASILSESFTNPTFPPPGWRTAHVSGIGGDWFRSTVGFRSAPACAQSDAGILLADNFLITKRVTPDSNDSLVFWVSSNYLLGALGRLDVKVSTTDSIVTSFIDFLIPFQLNLQLLTPNVYVRQAISLSAYAGQPIFIAFRHIEVLGVGGSIRLDDVSAGGIDLHLTVLLEGHVFSPTPRDRDTVTVTLRTAIPPYNIVESQKGYLDTLGKKIFNFSQGEENVRYYIVVSHRNHITTWSRAGGELFTGGSLNYDFTTDLSKAYSNNMKMVFGKATFYTGDIDQDGIVDASDLSALDNDSYNYVFGSYVVTDLNWDEFVDASDLSLCDNNAFNHVIEKSPFFPQ